MAALTVRMQALDQGTVHELKLKLSDAHKVVTDLERLTGRSAGAPKVRRERRPSIDDEHLQPQILAVMAENAKEGMNARQIAEYLHHDALLVRKFIASNPKLLKRTGKDTGTKFFLQ